MIPSFLRNRKYLNRGYLLQLSQAENKNHPYGKQIHKLQKTLGKTTIYNFYFMIFYKKNRFKLYNKAYTYTQMYVKWYEKIRKKKK